MKKIVRVLALSLCLCLGMAAMFACTPDVPFKKEGEIVVVTRSDGSGTKNAFLDIIGKKDKPDPSGVLIAEDTPAILTKVKSNPQTISYDSLGFLDDSVKKLKVDGIEPTPANIKDGRYLIARPLRVLFAPALETATNAKGEFLKYLKSKDAQKIVEEEGYVSDVIDTAPSYIKASSLSGTITITGSSSLYPLMAKLAGEFENLYRAGSNKTVVVTVTSINSAAGYSAAKHGTADFGMISDKTRKDAGSDIPSVDEAHEFTVARDGIAVIVSKKNPLNNITQAQLQNIFTKEGAGTDGADKETYSSWKVLIDANA